MMRLTRRSRFGLPASFAFAFLLLVPLSVSAQSIWMARDLYAHNLNHEALEEFIRVLYSANASPADRAEALYHMGQIAFEAGNYSVAFDDWERILREYPTMRRADELKARLAQLNNVVLRVSDTAPGSVLAQSYIRNGDFWSKANRVFTIDAAALQPVEMAVQWYDRVIQELPRSPSTELAYVHKIFTLLGWLEPGNPPTAYGARGDFERYMPQVVSTFEAFEKDFPTSPYAQAFRYQIAQNYWAAGNTATARPWLERIVQTADQASFYYQAAKARLATLQ